MTSVADAIVQCRGYLLGNTREEINVLNGSYAAGGTSLTFSDPMGSIAAGSEIEIDTELFRVRSISGSTAIVLGAQKGTTAANHSSGAVATINPRFYSQSILNDLNRALNDMSSAGLYREVSINVTFNPVVAAYDLAGSTSDSVLDVLEVRYQQQGPTKRYPLIQHWSLMRDMDTSVFTSGTALVIDSPGFPGLPLRVRYAANYTPITTTTDDLTTTCGVRSTADDLPGIGAAIRQMMGRDIKRTFLDAQPDTRRSAEVPPGVAQGALTYLRNKWEQGLQEERMRQTQRFPIRLAR